MKLAKFASECSKVGFGMSAISHLNVSGRPSSRETDGPGTSENLRRGYLQRDKWPRCEWNLGNARIIQGPRALTEQRESYLLSHPMLEVNGGKRPTQRLTGETDILHGAKPDPDNFTKPLGVILPYFLASARVLFRSHGCGGCFAVQKNQLFSSKMNSFMST